MKDEEIFELVLKHIGKNARIELDESKYDSDLVSLGLDSLDMIEAVSNIETDLNIEIDDRDINNLSTIRSIFEYIKKRNTK